MMAIEEAVIAEYGDHIHIAMRGKTANHRYFRRLAQALVPILLPRELQQSKYVMFHYSLYMYVRMMIMML